MRAVLQRVSEASVRVDDVVVGRIGPGLVALVCAMRGDTAATAEKLAAKVLRLRIFRDADGRMNRSVLDTGGAVLVVSQFTLAADVRGGNRPGFSNAAPPEVGEDLLRHFIEALRKGAAPVQTGRFGASMQVALVNDGPVTIWLEV